MKSPSELADKLASQWRQGATRSQRLGGGQPGFPVTLPIGRPGSGVVKADLATVRSHLDAWRAVSVGLVEWEERKYRSVAEPVLVPMNWTIRSTDEWATAVEVWAADRTSADQMLTELDGYRKLLAVTDPTFHPYLLRQRALVVATGFDTTATIVSVAAGLEPGQADGLPLRAMPLVGTDTKFFERHRRLITDLLDLRFDDAVTKLGLETFLGAAPSGGHWLLVVDLDGGLLPYPELRLTDQAISEHGLPGERLVVVENEQCRHLLPQVPGGIAVLGAGNNLAWLSAPTLSHLSVVYWGDIDTWGLALLAHARRRRPDLTPILMDAATYDVNADQAVPERNPSPVPETGLSNAEQELFHWLSAQRNGRLEQELLSPPTVRQTLDQLRE